MNGNAECTKMGAKRQNLNEFEDKIHTFLLVASSLCIFLFLNPTPPNLHLGLHMALRKLKLLPVQG